MRMILPAGNGVLTHEPESQYHPFHTLFQVVCDMVREYEPSKAKINELSYEFQDNLQLNHAPVNTAGEMRSRTRFNGQQSANRREPFRCFRCDSPNHMVCNCPEPPPRCDYCNIEGHKQVDCWKLHGKPIREGLNGGRPRNNPGRNRCQGADAGQRFNNRPTRNPNGNERYGNIRALDTTRALVEENRVFGKEYQD